MFQESPYRRSTSSINIRMGIPLYSLRDLLLEAKLEYHKGSHCVFRSTIRVDGLPLLFKSKH